MSKCHHCGADVSFMALLRTPNPLKFKCDSCKEDVHVDKRSGLIAVVAILAVIIPPLIMLYGTEHYLLSVVAPIAIAAEVFYFLLIKYGLVKLKNE
ncbi:hypothetical protein [Agaribacterium sp. ZY112]|uniref:hypothetical protein n=1 Tax=Agaribacterium sp. ZY112 TaxID=3233574 RepID=UPI0035234E63